LLNLGVTARGLGDRAQARTCLDACLALFRELGDTQNAGLALLNLGRLSHDEGDLERAATLYAESQAHFRTASHAQGIATTLNRLGELARERGDLARARQCHAEALALHRSRNDPWGIGISLTHQARVALAERDPARAVMLAGEGLRSLQGVGASRDTAAALVVTATALGVLGPAVTSVQLLGAAASAYSGGPEADAEQRSFEQAVAAAQAALPRDAFDAAWADGRRLTIDQAVALALATADLDAPPVSRPVQPTSAAPSAASLSVTPPASPPVEQRSAGPSVMNPLTPRERQVAALISRGLTNREIADALIISQMTADSHVSHILRKLEFRSRAQVAAWATEHGLTAPDVE
jgi:non-specific serine/threonine protein kinase